MNKGKPEEYHQSQLARMWCTDGWGGDSCVSTSMTGLTFEQQKELLLLKLDDEKELEKN